ncbi:MAG: nucleotidyl transferase AbiEii/AbiGii toxin family protein [Prevotellaceae bacterium]|jgi:predicted nucleotidyltransferase component of viral defense system|nr:nucleotidyl transferase AbiEii/AbiGii toxin family protein [Prevotellaceae bacterium]
MMNILKDIYSDLTLANVLGFKGGTALMLFHDLPRFSVDLDFDLLQAEIEKKVYEKLRKIVLQYGKIHDEAAKFYGIIIVLDYGVGERKLKVEISNRLLPAEYENLSYMGINVKTMTLRDMLSHKLCALLDRTELVSRDIFDVWFLLSKQTSVNRQIIEQRMQKPMSEYLQSCIDSIEQAKQPQLLSGLGELIRSDMKPFVKNKLKNEVLTLLRFYKESPI